MSERIDEQAGASNGAPILSMTRVEYLPRCSPTTAEFVERGCTGIQLRTALEWVAANRPVAFFGSLSRHWTRLWRHGASRRRRESGHRAQEDGGPRRHILGALADRHSRIRFPFSLIGEQAGSAEPRSLIP